MLMKHTEVGLLSPDFVPVLETMNDNEIVRFYGGNQVWYDKIVQKNGGCAPTAAANMLHYMLMKNAAISKKEFCECMDYAYKHVRPLEILRTNYTLGCFSLAYFAHGVRKIAMKKYSVTLKSHVMPFRQKTKKAAAIHFIATALKQDCPVALLTMFLKKADFEFYNVQTKQTSYFRYDRHWVTITKMATNKDGKLILTVSTWGGIGQIDFDDFWDKINASRILLPSGIVYFTKA